MNLRDFSRKKAWVTGAGQGIGFATAAALAEAGADVVGLDVVFPESTYPFRCVLLDLANSEQIETTCTELCQTHGMPEILVNAAGVLVQGDSAEVSLKDWQHCFDVNVSGPFQILRLLIPGFREQQRGAIINVVSNASKTPRRNMAAYCASKAALLSLSRCVALELAPFGVRCNTVSPGSTDTPMLRALLADQCGLDRTIKGVPTAFRTGIPLGKIATALEVANCILFLASDDASHITMHDLTVDGGATLGR